MNLYVITVPSIFQEIRLVEFRVTVALRFDKSKKDRKEQTNRGK